MAGAELPVLAFTAGILLGKGRKPTLPSSAMSACETRNGEKEKPVGPMALASLFQPGKSIADPLPVLMRLNTINGPDPQDEVYSRQDSAVIL